MNFFSVIFGFVLVVAIVNYFIPFTTKDSMKMIHTLFALPLTHLGLAVVLFLIGVLFAIVDSDFESKSDVDLYIHLVACGFFSRYCVLQYRQRKGGGT